MVKYGKITEPIVNYEKEIPNEEMERKGMKQVQTEYDFGTQIIVVNAFLPKDTETWAKAMSLS